MSNKLKEVLRRFRKMDKKVEKVLEIDNVLAYTKRAGMIIFYILSEKRKSKIEKQSTSKAGDL